MSDPRNPYDANDPFPGPTQPPTGPSHPAATYPDAPPTGPSTQPPYGGPDDEYVITSTAPPGPVPYRNAPDPFGGPSDDGPADPTGRRTAGGRRWLIPVAAVLVLAAIGAAVYLLLIKQGDGSSDSVGTSSTPAPESRSAAPSSEPSGGTSGSAAGTGAPTGSGASIAGSYQVNGIIESYTGPQTGQLGTAAKKPGDPAFKSPQTWTLSGDCVAAKPCELAISPGGATLTLTLDGGTWKGSVAESIQCSAAGQPTEATVAIAIPQSGGVATRTLSATCGQPLTEVDALTLTKK